MCLALNVQFSHLRRAQVTLKESFATAKMFRSEFWGMGGGLNQKSNSKVFVVLLWLIVTPETSQNSIKEETSSRLAVVFLFLRTDKTHRRAHWRRIISPPLSQEIPHCLSLAVSGESRNAEAPQIVRQVDYKPNGL